jgi:uncharacterized protein
MKSGFKIIDGHVHTFSTEIAAKKIIETFNVMYSIAFENTGNGTINNLLENMKESGVDYTVLANFAPPKIIHSNNTWTINMSKQHKELIALVSFHPDMKGSLRTHLEAYIIDGAKGIKLHPMAQGFVPFNKRFEELYDICNEIIFPIVFHCGRVSNARLNEYSDIEMIIPIIEKYPNIPVVLTHMADGNVEDVLRISKDYNNVFFDTSIVITGYPQIKTHNVPSWLDDGKSWILLTL